MKMKCEMFKVTQINRPGERLPLLQVLLIKWNGCYKMKLEEPLSDLGKKIFVNLLISANLIAIRIVGKIVFVFTIF